MFFADFSRKNESWAFRKQSEQTPLSLICSKASAIVFGLSLCMIPWAPEATASAAYSATLNDVIISTDVFQFSFLIVRHTTNPLMSDMETSASRRSGQRCEEQMDMASVPVSTGARTVQPGSRRLRLAESNRNASRSLSMIRSVGKGFTSPPKRGKRERTFHGSAEV